MAFLAPFVANHMRKQLPWLIAYAVIILIAIILIIIGIVYLSNNNYGKGFGYFIPGLVLGGTGGYLMYQLREANNPINIAKNAANSVASIFGRGEDEIDYDGCTVADVNEEDCGCTTRGAFEGGEQYDEDLNELDYLESSDEEGENPFEEVEEEEEEEEEVEKKLPSRKLQRSSKKTTKKVTKKSHKIKRGGDEGTVLSELKSLLEVLKTDDNSDAIDLLLRKVEEVKTEELDYDKVLDVLDEIISVKDTLIEGYKALEDTEVINEYIDNMLAAIGDAEDKAEALSDKINNIKNIMQ